MLVEATMGDAAGALAAAAGAFAATNLDDLVLLTVLFSASVAMGRPQPWQIWSGQYAGIGALTAVSAIAALGLTIVPERWIGLLGLLPLMLGVRGLIHAVRVDDDGELARAPAIATSAIAIAGLTIADGADNIAVYTPMFRAMSVPDAAVTIAVFALLTAVWCGAATLLGGHDRMTRALERWGHWIVPFAFVLIGAAILYETRVLAHLADLL